MYPMSRMNKTLVDYLIALAAMLLIVCIVGAGEHQFVVHNRMADFKVVNRCPPDVVKKTRIFVDHGYSVGHTHACPNPGCSFRQAYGEPYVWSHAMQSGHQCPHCGVSQYVAGYRPTTILRKVEVQEPVQRTEVRQKTEFRVVNRVYAEPAYPAVMQLNRLSFTASQGCANGQCSTVQTSKFRLFR